MSNPDYDGLCGVPLPHPQRGGTYLRCRLPMGHHGDHDWKKYEDSFFIRSYCGIKDREKPIQRILRKLEEEQRYGRTSQLEMAPGSNPDEA